MEESQIVKSILGTPYFDIQRKSKLYLVETKKGRLGSLAKKSKAGLIPTLMFTFIYFTASQDSPIKTIKTNKSRKIKSFI